jgi:hypothetical protein
LTTLWWPFSIAPVTDSPDLTPAKRREHEERERRLARALRENLHRRKQQARAREQGPRAAEPKPPRNDPSP